MPEADHELRAIRAVMNPSSDAMVIDANNHRVERKRPFTVDEAFRNCLPFAVKVRPGLMVLDLDWGNGQQVGGEPQERAHQLGDAALACGVPHIVAASGGSGTYHVYLMVGEGRDDLVDTLRPFGDLRRPGQRIRPIYAHHRLPDPETGFPRRSRPLDVDADTAAELLAQAATAESLSTFIDSLRNQAGGGCKASDTSQRARVRPQAGRLDHLKQRLQGPAPERGERSEPFGGFILAAAWRGATVDDVVQLVEGTWAEEYVQEKGGRQRIAAELQRAQEHVRGRSSRRREPDRELDVVRVALEARGVLADVEVPQSERRWWNTSGALIVDAILVLAADVGSCDLPLSARWLAEATNTSRSSASRGLRRLCRIRLLTALGQPSPELAAVYMLNLEMLKIEEATPPPGGAWWGCPTSPSPGRLNSPQLIMPTADTWAHDRRLGREAALLFSRHVAALRSGHAFEPLSARERTLWARLGRVGLVFERAPSEAKIAKVLTRAAEQLGLVGRLERMAARHDSERILAGRSLRC